MGEEDGEQDDDENDQYIGPKVRLALFVRHMQQSGA